MKIVLSRKGFDSANGGIPSPIFPDGRLMSLPIPVRDGKHGLQHLDLPDVDVPQMVADLRGPRREPIGGVHLDPDLARSVSRRPKGWRPALGQAGSALSHLRNQAVGEGSLFLFFGWFRDVERYAGRWRFAPRSKDRHVLFGWLEVGDVFELPLGRDVPAATREAMSDHAHVVRGARPAGDRREALYIAKPKSAWTTSAEFGGGVFPRYSDDLCLTAPGRSRSQWSLPGWFEPRGRKAFSYHDKPGLWAPEGDRVILQSAAIGQEFVLDADHYDEAEYWAALLIERNSA